MRDIQTDLLRKRPTIGAEVHLPFGAPRRLATDIAKRDGGRRVFDWKSIYVDFSGRLHDADRHVDPGG